MILEKRPAIVVVAFNRASALSRLLKSIERAIFEFDDIPLIISIDGGGIEEVIDVAKKFQWSHGKKEIIVHKNNIGLRSHVLECGDLSEKYGSIIMLEEDCFVSRFFYEKAFQLILFYYRDENIGGISLYSYNFNENAFLPFSPLSDGFDSYFMQVPTSSGQAWTWQQWSAFRDFLDSKPQISKSDKLPDNIKEWPESSWKKYFYKYLVTYNKFIVYPQVSLSVNFGDAGTHYGNQTEIWQVPLEQGMTPLNLVSFIDSINKYDAYFEIYPELIGLEKDTLLDLYGTKQLELFEEEFTYSIKSCNIYIKSFGINLKPAYLNILYNIEGNFIYYGKRENFTCVSEKIRNKLTRDINEFTYKAGLQEGKKEGYQIGKSFILNSKPYKLGNVILSPLRRFLELMKSQKK